MTKRINIFFDKYEKTIQCFSNIIQAITVVILVIVTICYAKCTSEMSKIMEREFVVSNRPYITLTGREINPVVKPQGEVLEFSITISNEGKIPARISNLEVEVEGTKKLLEKFEKNYIINPNDEYEQAIVDMGMDTKNYKQQFRVKYEYYSAERNMPKDKYCIEYILDYPGNTTDKILISDSSSDCN